MFQRPTPWEEGFRKLLEFIDERGTSRVPQSYSTGGFRLGTWVTLQRKAYFGGTLDADQVKRLGALPQWSWNPRDDAWEEGFRRPAEYTRQHGQAQMPQTYTEADGYRPGSWVTTQRTARDKGTLSAERIKSLEALPGWSWDPGAEAWEEHFRGFSISSPSTARPASRRPAWWAVSALAAGSRSSAATMRRGNSPKTASAAWRSFPNGGGARGTPRLTIRTAATDPGLPATRPRPASNL